MIALQLLVTGHGLLPMMVTGILSLGSIVVGVTLAATATKPRESRLGAVLGVFGLLILVGSCVWYDRLAELF